MWLFLIRDIADKAVPNRVFPHVKAVCFSFLAEDPVHLILKRRIGKSRHTALRQLSHL